MNEYIIHQYEASKTMKCFAGCWSCEWRK